MALRIIEQPKPVDRTENLAQDVSSPNPNISEEFGLTQSQDVQSIPIQQGQQIAGASQQQAPQQPQIAEQQGQPQSLDEQLPSLNLPLGPLEQPVREVQNIAGRAVAGAVGLPGTLLSVPTSLLGAGEETRKKFFPSTQELVSSAEEQGNLRKASSFMGHVLDRVAESAPLTFGIANAMQSAPLGWALGKDVAASIGAEAGKPLGFFGELVGGILGGGAFGKMSNFVRRVPEPAKLLQLADTTRGKAADLERQLGANINRPAGDFASDVKKFNAKIAGTTFKDSTIGKTMNDLANNMFSDIKPNRQVNASALVERQRNINQLAGEVRSPQAKKFLDQARSIVKNKINDIGETAPKWHDAWDTTNKLTQAMGYGNALNDFLSSVPKVGNVLTNPLAKTALGLASTGTAGALGGPLTAATAAAGGLAATKGREVWGFLQDKKAQKVLKEATNNLINRNHQGAFKAVQRLNKAAEEFEEKREEKSSKPIGRLKIIE